jgi:hypothetical protein
MSNIFSINQLTLILKIIDQYDVIDYIMTLLVEETEVPEENYRHAACH